MRTQVRRDDGWITLASPRGARRDAEMTQRAALLGFTGTAVRSWDLTFVSGCDASDAATVAETLLDEPFLDDDTPALGHRVASVEVALRPGVTDRVARQVEASAARIGVSLVAATGARHEVSGPHAHDPAVLARLAGALLANPVIETWSLGSVVPGFVGDAAPSMTSVIETVALRGLDGPGLLALGASRGLALDADELECVRAWFVAEGRDPTDAELEMIAQTWSEHCSHKTFRAAVTTDDGEVAPLMGQLRAVTAAIAAPFVVSAFEGNAGIVRFGTMGPLAVKVETHNHPSAVEPFGGANTGVGGVVRDVLAAPARPVALTDILCFGPADLDPSLVAAGVLHPAVITEGVIAGVADYGNKIGVPTVAGAVIYDRGYVENPLVFCGCVGEVMAGHAALDGPRPGDRIVVIGGGTGRDGIRGATFSSMTMDATTGEVAGASVQIGDPIVERLVGEVLVDLLDRDDPPCTALTDCGAGGLSSAVGEMAEHTGARVDLGRVALKYAGLAPWEVWLSEAQERMVLAVDPARGAEVAAACAARGVGMSDIGEFTSTGRIVVTAAGESVVDLPAGFLHGGRPARRMPAVLRAPGDGGGFARVVPDHRSTLLALLAHPTISSKEQVIRRYDHHVGGATVTGPMAGPHQTGPSDGTVIARPAAREGFAVGVGVNPQYGIHDPEAMAWSGVDEAVRNIVAAGGDPSAVALLDNFSWGDPTRPETLGDLVLAVRGCCAAALAHSAPFVSGKDSLNNEYERAGAERHSIPPTLVITALAHVPDVDRAPGSAVCAADSVLVVTGATHDELRGSHLDLVLGADHGGRVPGPCPSAPEAYRCVHRAVREGLVRSAHDVSEGGLAVALAEMALSRPGTSLECDLTGVHEDPTVALYSESNGRIVLEVAPGDLDRVLDLLAPHAAVIGRTVAGGEFVLGHSGTAVTVETAHLLAAWGKGA